MRLNILIGILLLTIGLVAGQKLTMMAYDPKTLEDLVIDHTRVVYATGCSEGIKAITGKKETLLFCLDLAEKTVKDQEDIIRNKAWNK